MNKYLSKTGLLTIILNTTSLGMITAPKLHSQRQPQQKLSKNRSLFFTTSLCEQLNTNKALLLLKNEPESKEELLYDTMLHNDTKNTIMCNLDFKSERAYWCTNKENNTLGHFNWIQRRKLNPLLPENFNQCTSKISFIYKDPKYSNLQRSEHDSLSAAVATRSHEQLKKILKKREDYFAVALNTDEMDLIFKKNTRLAKLLAMQTRNMAAIELLLEHQCNVHNIYKESLKKFYNIEGYKNYLDIQIKKNFRRIDRSIKSSDAEYFKLLVKCIHPDIINHPVQQKTLIRDIYIHPRKEASTILDYVYERCHNHLYQSEDKDVLELNWSLINFLRKYGAVTYKELMTSPQQTNPYGFKLPQDYHETGFIIRDEQNLMCYWVHPDLLNPISPVKNSSVIT